MLTALLIVLSGALPEPRYNVDGIVLMQSEAIALHDSLANHHQQVARRIREIQVRVAEAEAEIAELEADNTQASLASAAKIEAGVVERGKLAVARIAALPAPSAADVRRDTLRKVYNPDNGQLRHDPNNDGVLDRAESGWPTFVFNAISGGGDTITAAAMAAYWAGLDG